LRTGKFPPRSEPGLRRQFLPMGDIVPQNVRERRGSLGDLENRSLFPLETSADPSIASNI
jgi:hypothetical protein